MSLRKDVYELLSLYDWQERRQGFKPARFLPVPDKPPPFRPEGKLVFRSEVPDRLLPAYDIAMAEELVEQWFIEPDDQLESYRSMGWPKGMPDVPQDKPWPLVPDWNDAYLLTTDKGRAAIARYAKSTPEAEAGEPLLKEQVLAALTEQQRIIVENLWGKETGLRFSAILGLPKAFRQGVEPDDQTIKDKVREMRRRLEKKGLPVLFEVDGRRLTLILPRAN